MTWPLLRAGEVLESWLTLALARCRSREVETEPFYRLRGLLGLSVGIGCRRLSSARLFTRFESIYFTDTSAVTAVRESSRP